MAYISNLLPIPRLDFVTYSKAGFCYLFQGWIFVTYSKAGFCYLFQGFVDLLPIPRLCGFCYLFQGFVDFVTYSKALWILLPIPRLYCLSAAVAIVFIASLRRVVGFALLSRLIV